MEPACRVVPLARLAGGDAAPPDVMVHAALPRPNFEKIELVCFPPPASLRTRVAAMAALLCPGAVGQGPGLAGRQPVQVAPSAPAADHERLDDLRVDDRPAGGDRPHGAQQLVDLADLPSSR